MLFIIAASLTKVCSGNLGAKTYLIFTGWMLFCIIVTYFYLPETKDRSAAALDVMFAAKVPARKFKCEYSYIHCA
jgi:SP family sugar:H+ symporter-like MFS transporter